MLQTCIDLESKDQGLILLTLISNDLPASPTQLSLESNYADAQFEGIKSSHVAVTLAKFIRMAGWKDCEEGVLRLLCSPKRIAVQMEFLCTLVTSLVGHGLSADAVQIADRICPVLLFSQFRWNSATIVNAAEMIFYLDLWAESNDVNRVESFIRFVPSIETLDLCHVIIRVQKNLSQSIKRVPDMEKCYRDICKILVERDLINVRSVSYNGENIMIDVAKCLLSLDVWEILLEFLKQVTFPLEGNNDCLQSLVSSGSVYEACQGSQVGKKTWQTLVDFRLRELSLLKPPVFSWRQNAVMPKYPEVEEFFRSNRIFTVFSHTFSSYMEANQWAIENFGFGYEAIASPDSRFFHDHHYSATVHIKKIKDGSVLCEITKNRRFFEYSVRQFELRQQEINTLLKRLRSESTDATNPLPPKRVKFAMKTY